ncbi:hypothetical protein JDV02_000063 [Purpureocillium takamizusanense]|uniref:Tse2 ADP-ribosyltransferase toxin domain-containing protein n=1 Tax=Purpureocillium takamizusanense TaxID=2060973 RepID=A0A9Q8Q6B2_9HYPO|nr:uncharacterized protein JDV02_000063 [Purpureocillium takamizusanense]UNI13306.1 hypothetical protein JDV02_000063 [Purpureocillium takamizusanense]
MIGRVYGFARSLRQPHTLLRRQYSVKAIYSSFPATLHYYCPRRTSALFNHQEIDSRPDDMYDEGVIVQSDGLVYPAVSKTSASNGAILFPNTFMMQELVRQYFDDVLDRQDEGKQIESPFICTIPKGTPIPGHLILINEYLSRFSLQPSHGMLLEDLNRSLDEFYKSYARRETVENWLDTHPFPQAVADDADAVWMAK